MKYKKCENCGTNLTNRGLPAKFCSKKCRNEYHRKIRQISSLGVNGKTIYGLNKRPQHLNHRCELNELCLCKKLKYKYNRLHWHHWNDKHLNNGIWCCWICHWILEQLEQRGNNEFLKFIQKSGIRYSDLRAIIHPFQTYE